MAGSKEVVGVRDAFSKATGEVLAGTVLAALFWSALGASRLAAATSGSWLSAALGSTALALVPFLLLVLFFRWIGTGFATLVPSVENRSFWVCVLATWASCCALGLRVFGAMLYSGTHHRGLGGATFGIVGFLAAAGCGVVVLRLGQWLRRALERRALAWVLACLATVAILLSTRAATQGAQLAPAAVAAWDALAAFLFALLASGLRIPPPYHRLTTPASGGVFVLLVAVGLLFAPGIAKAQGPLEPKAPLLAPLLALVGHPSAPVPVGSNSASSASASSGQMPRPGNPEELASPTGKAGEKPDIILVSLDSVRADHLGVYGYKRPTSAKLDAFAGQSAVFERAYAAGPETRTAITPLVTGRYLEQCAHDDRPWPTLLDTEETVAERLQKGGYATGAVLSFQWLSKERGFAQGFELFDETPFRKVHAEKWSTSAHAIAQSVRAYEELLKKQRPLFLWVHLFDAHQKYLEHSEFEFGDKDIDHYDAEVAFQDQQLVRLLERVQAGPRASKTVWLIHGTHGEAFGEHGLKGHPPAGFDEIVRVPLIVRLPWGSSRRVTDTVSTVDLAPTIVDLAGLPRTGMVGQSLRELADGSPPSEDGPEGVLVSYAGVPGTKDREQLRAWIVAPQKLVVHGDRVSLFDYAADPEEKQDLAPTKLEDVKRLRSSLNAFIAKTSADH